jgi:hypothetical protein
MQTLMVVIGFIGPFAVLGIIGIFILHHMNKSSKQKMA